MTKTLTEQWKDGKLPENTYYVQFICGRYGIYEFEQFKGFGFENDSAYIKEVLAAVPSYDHFSQLAKKVERLQEQLNEANAVIKTTNRVSGNIDLSQLVYEDRRKVDGITMQTGLYLEKWGVK